MTRECGRTLPHPAAAVTAHDACQTHKTGAALKKT
jgi:hypothetical protein